MQYTTTILTLLTLLPLTLAAPTVSTTNTSPNPRAAAAKEWGLSFYTDVNCSGSSPDGFGDSQAQGCTNLDNSIVKLLGGKASGTIGQEGGYLIALYNLPNCKTNGETPIFNELEYDGDCLSLDLTIKNQMYWQSFEVIKIK